MSQSLDQIFSHTMLLSGTPDHKQIKLTNMYPEYECACSFKEAMDNKWICKPTLNLITCSNNSWPSAVKAVYEHECKIWKESNSPFRPVILVNCKSIDDVYKLRNEAWFKDRAGKEFHFISIHSDKTIGENNEEFRITAEIDGESKNAEVAYEAIENIDSMTDNMPVLVAQVQMIGEGINVKSFNAVITSSSTDKTAIQQIGRCLRNNYVIREETAVEEIAEEIEVVKPKNGFFNKLFKKTETTRETVIKKIEKKVDKIYNKVDHGHANVYVIKDNVMELTNLIVNLNNFDLTEDCFTWGKQIDVNNGSVPEINIVSEASKLAGSDWLDIDAESPEILEIIGNARNESYDRAADQWLSGEDNDGNGIPDIEEFKILVNSDELKNWSSSYFGKHKKTDDEKYKFLMYRLMYLIKQPSIHQVWKKSEIKCLNLAFQNEIVSKFMLEHMSKKAKCILDGLS